jgi:two-component system response regulator AtoC
VAESKSTVLLQGESGTGKELIARAIHTNGPRRDKPFIPVNCGALPDTLLESEMFGYEKGAFTGAVGTKIGLFESATGGTLFLDEIGELGQALQVKLLRVMQDQEVRRVGSTTSTRVDVRIIAATNRDLEQLVKEGKFRKSFRSRCRHWSTGGKTFRCWCITSYKSARQGRSTRCEESCLKRWRS